jgi:hypothetical protein
VANAVTVTHLFARGDTAPSRQIIGSVNLVMKPARHQHGGTFIEFSRRSRSSPTS